MQSLAWRRASESGRGTGGDVRSRPPYERGSHVPGVKRPGSSTRCLWQVRHAFGGIRSESVLSVLGFADADLALALWSHCQ
jgi:hypothetical protein